MLSQIDNSLNIQNIHSNGDSSIQIGMFNHDDSFIMSGEIKSGVLNLNITNFDSILEENYPVKITGTISESELRKNLIFGIKVNTFDLDRTKINKSFFYNGHVITVTDTVIRNVDIDSGTNRRVVFDNIGYVSYNYVIGRLFVISSDGIQVIDKDCETIIKTISNSVFLESSGIITGLCDFIVGDDSKIILFSKTDTGKISEYIVYDYTNDTIIIRNELDNYLDNEEIMYSYTFNNDSPVALLLKSDKITLDIYAIDGTSHNNIIDSEFGLINEFCDIYDNNYITFKNDKNSIYRAKLYIDNSIDYFELLITNLNDNEHVTHYFNNDTIIDTFYDNVYDKGYITITNDDSNNKSIVQIYRSWNRNDYSRNYTKDLFIEIPNLVVSSHIDSLESGNLTIISKINENNISVYTLNREKLNSYISEFNTRLNAVESSSRSNTNSIKSINNTLNNLQGNLNKPITYKNIPMNESGVYDVDLIREEGWYQTTVVGSSLIGVPARLPNERFTILAIPLYSENSIILFLFSDDTSSGSSTRTNKAIGYKFINSGVASNWYRLAGLDWDVDKTYTGFLRYSDGKIIDSTFNHTSFLNKPTNINTTNLINYNSSQGRIEDSNISRHRFLEDMVGYEDVTNVENDLTLNNLVFYIDSDNVGNNINSTYAGLLNIYNLTNDKLIGTSDPNSHDLEGFHGIDSDFTINDQVFKNDTNLVDTVYKENSEFSIEFVYKFKPGLESDTYTIFNLGPSIIFQKYVYYTRFVYNTYSSSSGKPVSTPISSSYDKYGSNEPDVLTHIVLTGNINTGEFKVYKNGTYIGTDTVLSKYDGYVGLYCLDLTEKLIKLNTDKVDFKYLKIYNKILSNTEVSDRFKKRFAICENDFINKKYESTIIDHLNKNVNDILLVDVNIDSEGILKFPNIKVDNGAKFKIKFNKDITYDEYQTIQYVNVNGVNYFLTLNESGMTLVSDIINEIDNTFYNSDKMFYRSKVYDFIFDVDSFICLNLISPYSEYSYSSAYSNYSVKGTDQCICNTSADEPIKEFYTSGYFDFNDGDRITVFFTKGLKVLDNDQDIKFKVNGYDIYNVSYNGIDYSRSQFGYLTYGGPIDFIYYNNLNNMGPCFYIVGNNSVDYSNRSAVSDSLHSGTVTDLNTIKTDYYGLKMLQGLESTINKPSDVLDEFYLLDYIDKTNEQQLLLSNAGIYNRFRIDDDWENWTKILSAPSDIDINSNKLLCFSNNLIDTANDLNIDGIDINSGTNIHYGICNTLYNNPNKTVSINGFKLINGSRLSIKFFYPNTETGEITLNVNNTGAKRIVIHNYYGNCDVGLILKQSSVIDLIYDQNEDVYFIIGHNRSNLIDDRTYHSSNTLTDYPNIPPIDSCIYLNNINTSANSIMLLPGNYNFDDNAYSVNSEYIHGRNNLNKKLFSEEFNTDNEAAYIYCDSSYYSNGLLDLSDFSKNSVIFENIVFRCTGDKLLIKINNNKKVKFINCIFYITDCSSVMMLDNGELEFNDCVFYITNSISPCSRIVDAYGETDSDIIIFNNCEINGLGDLNHPYCCTLRGKNPKLKIYDSIINKMSPYEIYNFNNSTDRYYDIDINRCEIYNNVIGGYQDNSLMQYMYGSFKFTNNNMYINGLSYIYIQGGNSSIITNNVISTLNSNKYYVTFSYYTSNINETHKYQKNIVSSNTIHATLVINKNGSYNTSSIIVSNNIIGGTISNNFTNKVQENNLSE